MEKLYIISEEVSIGKTFIRVWGGDGGGGIYNDLAKAKEDLLVLSGYSKIEHEGNVDNISIDDLLAMGGYSRILYEGHFEHGRLILDKALDVVGYSCKSDSWERHVKSIYWENERLKAMSSRINPSDGC